MSKQVQADPLRAERVLSFSEVIAGLGISKATFFRKVKKKLPVVRLSDRRLGVRESDYRAYLDNQAA